MSKRTIQWGGVAGMTFVVLILITIFGVSQPPTADDAIDKIRTYLVDNRTALLLFNALGLFAIPFVLWFAVVLRDVVRVVVPHFGIRRDSGLPALLLLEAGSVSRCWVH